ncbi:MAG TPA: ABC transporter permease subunit [Stellaceae bacterium]|jgi:ABC-type nitrate/sulfonate/bicarbonate transport system permease component|nr:ABC transporter permease subunit [Stellaceae bacterium]
MILTGAKPGGTLFMRSSAVWVQLLFLAILLTLWYLAANDWNVPALLLPEPTGVFHRAVGLIADGEIVEPLQTTLFEAVTAFLTSAILGIAFGYFLSTSPFMTEVCDPLLTSINAIPAILFLPLFALLFGLGSGSKIALGITVSFFPITLQTLAAFTNVDKVHIRAAQSMGASAGHMIRYVLLPSTLPVIVAGLRMGMVLSFLAIIGGETIASFAGLGHQVAESSQAMDAELMYAWIVIVITVSALLNLGLSQLEKLGVRS